MLYASAMLGLGGGVGEIAESFEGNTVNATNLTVYTFSAHAIGVADSNRKVIVCVQARDAASVSTLTIGGISASMVVAQTNGATVLTEIWEAVIPTGTTADIVVTLADAALNCSIGVYTAYNAQTVASATAMSTADPMVASILMPGGGLVVAVAADVSTSTYSWTGLAENYDETVEGADSHTGAWRAQPQSVNISVTCNPINAAVNPSMVLAAWAPV